MSEEQKKVVKAVKAVKAVEADRAAEAVKAVRVKKVLVKVAEPKGPTELTPDLFAAFCMSPSTSSMTAPVRSSSPATTSWRCSR